MLVLHILSAQICLAICVLLYLTFGINLWLLWGLAVIGFPLLSFFLLNLGRLWTQGAAIDPLTAVYLATKEPINEER